MGNLFSVFDPRTGLLRLNWMRVIFCILVVPSCYWKINSMVLHGVINFWSRLGRQLKVNLGGTNSPGILLFSVTLFRFIALNNFLGLIPYVFTARRHMIYTMGLALPLWLGFIVRSWFLRTSYMLAHLVPQGTPVVLIRFIVLIELVRNVIRPLTLRVRLIANMVAGHLLLSLIGGFMFQIGAALFRGSMLLLICLLVLECAVAVIQAYVFCLLVLLYIAEVNVWTVN